MTQEVDMEPRDRPDDFELAISPTPHGDWARAVAAFAGELTPAMVQAGVRAFYSFDSAIDGALDGAVRVWCAMRLAQTKMEWQPISTAPKSPDFDNEIRILLWGPKFESIIVIGWWRPTGDDGSGIWFTGEDEGGIGWGECEPTHWMPLPAPPSSTS